MKCIVIFFGLITLLLTACSQHEDSLKTHLAPKASLTAHVIGSWQKMGGALDFTASRNAVNPQLMLD
ncbi:MAG: hypothetical protein ACRCYY_14090 [Trueperaceae bacterium]